MHLPTEGYDSGGRKHDRENLQSSPTGRSENGSGARDSYLPSENTQREVET
jgi:hypothetical protein